MRFFALLFITTFIIGCSNTPETKSRYSIKQDKAPVRLPTVTETRDIIPGFEPYSRGGNKNYTVRGISYQVLKQATDFQQIGNASWYGQKFHGHLTSNGETYDMYGLSAAHTQLPLPSFVKVTNLVNNKEVVVRVNDRGPFHPNRIIDLSYGAAHRLGMLNAGTTRVKIEVLTFSPNPAPELIPVSVPALSPVLTPALTPAQTAIDKSAHPVLLDPAPAKQSRCVVQLAATSNKQTAQTQLSKIAKQYQVTSQLEPAGRFVRMQLGPLAGKQNCDLILKKITDNYPKAFIKML